MRFERQAIFHVGGRWLFGVPMLVALPWLPRDRWGRLALGTALWTVLATCFTRGAMPHYSAPITALVLGSTVYSLRIIAGWMRRREVALVVVGGFVAIWLSSSSATIRRAVEVFDIRMARSHVVTPPDVPVPAAEDFEHHRERRRWERFSRYAIMARQSYVDRFENDGDRHLILVRYAPGSRRHREWVYNRAEIDRAASVWATWNPKLPLWPILAYFKDRRVWLIEPERDPWMIRPFPFEKVGTWYLRRRDRAQAVVLPTRTAVDPVRVEITDAGTEPWHLQIERAHPPVVADRMYRSRFTARADAPRGIRVGVTQGRTPWRNLGLHRQLHLTEQWRTFSFRFRANHDEPVPRLVFGLGSWDVGVEITGVELSSETIP